MKQNSILLALLLAMTATITQPLFNFTSPDVGIDLGTQNTLVCVCRGDGEIEIIADVPSVVAIDARTKQVLCIGQEAKNMLGKTPAHIMAIRPMQDGVIKDFDIAEAMLRYIFQKATDYQTGWFRGPRMIVGVPCSVTDPEVRAIKEAAIKTGAREVYTIMEPMAAAIGADMPIEEAKGTMVVDIGGGTTDIVVISLKAPVVAHAVRIAGDAFDRAIMHYVRQKYNLNIGEQTAEKIKKEIGAVWIDENSVAGVEEITDKPANVKNKSMKVGGADVMTGIPRTITLTSKDIVEATNDAMNKIIFAIRDVLNNTPAELASDITQNGIVLVGGGALFRGIDKRINNELGLKVKIPKNPLQSVVQGIGKVAANFDYYKESLFDKNYQITGASN
jgi:rod shape-determining protein MreB